MPTFRIPIATALGAIAFFLVLVITDPPGPGLDPDAVSYVSAAWFAAHGGSFLVPDDGWDNTDSTMALAHFPPGYPAAVAVPVALGMPGVQSARLVDAAAAFVTIALVAWLVGEIVGTGAGILVAVVLMVTPALVDVHESVLSEPLFLALLAITLALMVRAPGKPLRAGVAAGAAALVRYAGVCAIGAVGLWWLLRRGDPRRRIRDAFVAVLPGVLSLVVWAARTAHENHDETIRQFSLYGQLGPTIREGAGTVAGWLAPSLDGWMRSVAAVLVAALLVWLFAIAARRRVDGARPNAARLLAALAVMAVAYSGVVVLSRVVADPGIPLDERLLSPLILVVEIAVVVALALWWPARRRVWRLGACLLLAAWGTGSLLVTLDSVQYALETGNDYADESWFGSSLIDWVRTHGNGRPVFTNVPTALYFHAGRMARSLPDDLDSATVHAFADTVRARHGLIIAFNRGTDFIQRADSLLARVPVTVLARFPDGVAVEVTP
ncbi:MAG TPA: glycosyltransferase family 39 protein [Gemmatimonadaceae bacterium]|nr:glycosyltransferase family 39 protein [Gemmatimonadaceae bacterium]